MRVSVAKPQIRTRQAQQPRGLSVQFQGEGARPISPISTTSKNRAKLGGTGEITERFAEKAPIGLTNRGFYAAKWSALIGA